MSITLTKKSVDEVQPKLYRITLNLKCVNVSDVTYIDKDFSGEHRLGDAPSLFTGRMLAAMQTAIDEYKAEQVIFNASQLNTAITALQSNLQE